MCSGTVRPILHSTNILLIKPNATKMNNSNRITLGRDVPSFVLVNESELHLRVLPTRSLCLLALKT